MQKSLTLFIAMILTAAMVSGCANRNWTGGDTGAVIGGVVGGAAGSQIGSGTGSTIATVVGAVAGAVLGRQLGQRMTGRDRQLFGSTLATNSAGETTSWTNDATNDSYWVTPTDTYTANSRECREFTMKANVDGTSDRVTGTACRQPDGTWVVQ